jgi:cell wall-associated NlpC family hydrolase
VTNSQREQIVAEAKTWLGTPFHHQGRVKGAGVDCVMLLLEVYAATGIIKPYDPGFYPHDWHYHRSDEKYLEGMLKFASEIPGPPQPGDVALFKFGRAFSHGAIAVEWPICIHSYVCRGVELVDIGKDAEFWGRPAKFFSVEEQE